MDKLKKLLSMCKCGFFLTINQHRDYYQTVQHYLGERDGWDSPPEIEQEIRDKMIETDTVVELQFYPDTPIGSYEIYHYDLDMAIDVALSCFDE